MKITDLKVDIYADGADFRGMLEMHRKGIVRGFTTNPSLVRKAGVKNYTAFAKDVLQAITDMPISLEVFADDFVGMREEALTLSGYGQNAFIKIPITNSKGESSIPLIADLSKAGIHLNVTAVFTIPQVEAVLEVLREGTSNIVSVFAGRIADTGVDAEDIMRNVANLCHSHTGARSLWASCREVFNIIQADRCGVDIITVPNTILSKIDLLGKNLEEFSLETVQMFERDGRSLGFSIL